MSIIASCDNGGKGYLTHTELLKNASSEMLWYLNSRFECRIAYSVLASHLQHMDNNSSADMLRHGEKVQMAHICSFLQM